MCLCFCPQIVDAIHGNVTVFIPSLISEPSQALNGTDDSAYNSFQYWRAPLPELNLSLLEDPGRSPSKDEPEYKDSSSEFMET